MRNEAPVAWRDLTKRDEHPVILSPSHASTFVCFFAFSDPLIRPCWLFLPPNLQLTGPDIQGTRCVFWQMTRDACAWTEHAAALPRSRRSAGPQRDQR